MNLIVIFFRLNFGLFRFICSFLIIFAFNAILNKKITVLNHSIEFDKIIFHKKILNIHNAKYLGMKTKLLEIGTINPFIKLNKLSIMKVDFNLLFRYKNGLEIISDFLNKKVLVNAKIHDGNIKILVDGLDKMDINGHYSPKGMLLKFNNGLFIYNDNSIKVKSDQNKYFIDLDAYPNLSKINKMLFYMKDRKLKLIFDKEWNFNSENKHIKVDMKLNEDLKGDGRIKISKKFGIFDADLNFGIDAYNMKVQIYDKGKQEVKISDFNLNEKDVKWNLNFSAIQQNFALKSKSINLNAKFLTDHIKFDLILDSAKIDLSAFGKLYYNENIDIEGYGDYVSLLDMKSLFKIKSANIIKGKFKWHRAKWIGDLIINDMKFDFLKSAKGFELCSIDGNFEKNPILLQKHDFDSPLQFKVWNFARAFELMYGDKLFKSTSVLDGHIHVGKKNMPWEFILHDFESMSRLNAIYLQVLSLKFWASLIKGDQKKWDYLSGNGEIIDDKYIVNNLEMNNNYFHIKAHGFIHRFKDMIEMHGNLRTKSISDELRSIINDKNRKGIKFHMHGSIKSPKIDNDLKFRKIATPILPLTLLLL